MTSSSEFEEKEAKASEPLEPAVRNRAEESLGLDLSGVRVHRGAEGARVSGAEGALAVTRGQQLYFAPRAYAPDTAEGAHLVAHELAHAAQAGGSGEATARGELEAEADRVAEAVAANHRAHVRGHAAAGMALKQEVRTPPLVARHDVEIAPTPPWGTVTGGGLSIPYVYSTAAPQGLSALTLQVPEGVAVAVTALNAEASEHRVQHAEGNRARAVVVSLDQRLARPPRIQIAFTRGTSTYIVVFRFSHDDAPARPAPARAKGPRP